jgi:hypothetical protein
MEHHSLHSRSHTLLSYEFERQDKDGMFELRVRSLRDTEIDGHGVLQIPCGISLLLFYFGCVPNVRISILGEMCNEG